MLVFAHILLIRSSSTQTRGGGFSSAYGRRKIGGVETHNDLN